MFAKACTASTRSLRDCAGMVTVIASMSTSRLMMVSREPKTCFKCSCGMPSLSHSCRRWACLAGKWQVYGSYHRKLSANSHENMSSTYARRSRICLTLITIHRTMPMKAPQRPPAPQLPKLLFLLTCCSPSMVMIWKSCQRECSGRHQ